jgi:hypothetical protein
MGVNKVDLSTGETLIDISKDTVTPQTLAKGYTAHNSNGEQIVGTMPAEGGGSGDSNVTVTFDMDISTLSASNFSHTYEEIVTLLTENKNILAKGNFGLGYCFGQLVAYNALQNVLLFQIMLQFNFGDGVKLYYFSLVLVSNNSITVNPYIVNTTSMLG